MVLKRHGCAGILSQDPNTQMVKRDDHLTRQNIIKGCQCAHVLHCHVKIAFLLTFYVFGYCFRTLAFILALDLLVSFQLGAESGIKQRLTVFSSKATQTLMTLYIIPATEQSFVNLGHTRSCISCTAYLLHSLPWLTATHTVFVWQLFGDELQS